MSKQSVSELQKEKFIEDESKYFVEFYEKLKGQKKETDSATYSEIPKFYFKVCLSFFFSFIL